MAAERLMVQLDKAQFTLAFYALVDQRTAWTQSDPRRPMLNAVLDRFVAAEEAVADSGGGLVLLTNTEVARALGVSRQRAHQIARNHAAFPSPYARCGTGALWTPEDIDNFACTRGMRTTANRRT